MHELSQADKFLIEQIRQGREEGWRQLVERYQGRLLAFARSRLKQSSDAEDVVQESFLTILKGLESFRGESSLETFLFVILRRRIVDYYRGPQMNLCLLQDTLPASIGEDDAHDQKIDRLAAPDLTASSYARKKEDRTICREELACAMENLIEGLKQDLNFRDLQIIEMVFYCQLRNKDIAGVLNIDEKQIALIKHRAIKQIQGVVQKSSHSDLAGSDDLDGLLCELWQEHRLSCLKRSTIGSYLLGTLDKNWHEYVHFHLESLGCRFCRANFDDLQNQTRDESAAILRNRILQSTVGFLSR
jgi:RNA polymerase sigma factor (sigma-70 family)